MFRQLTGGFEVGSGRKLFGFTKQQKEINAWIAGLNVRYVFRGYDDNKFRSPKHITVRDVSKQSRKRSKKT